MKTFKNIVYGIFALICLVTSGTMQQDGNFGFVEMLCSAGVFVFVTLIFINLVTDKKNDTRKQTKFK